MITLYNLQSDNDEYRINKWTDGNIESSYHVGREGCTCPAGHRHTCRHRQMIGNLIPIVDSHYFWNFDRGIAVDINNIPKSYYDSLVAPRCTPGPDQITHSIPPAITGNSAPLIAPQTPPAIEPTHPRLFRRRL